MSLDGGIVYQQAFEELMLRKSKEAFFNGGGARGGLNKDQAWLIFQVLLKTEISWNFSMLKGSKDGFASAFERFDEGFAISPFSSDICHRVEMDEKLSNEIKAKTLEELPKLDARQLQWIGGYCYAVFLLGGDLGVRQKKQALTKLNPFFKWFKGECLTPIKRLVSESMKELKGLDFYQYSVIEDVTRAVGYPAGLGDLFRAWNRELLDKKRLSCFEFDTVFADTLTLLLIGGERTAGNVERSFKYLAGLSSPRRKLLRTLLQKKVSTPELFDLINTWPANKQFILESERLSLDRSINSASTEDVLCRLLDNKLALAGALKKLISVETPYDLYCMKASLKRPREEEASPKAGGFFLSVRGSSLDDREEKRSCLSFDG